MKIGHNLFKCPWCLEEIQYKRNSKEAEVNPSTNSFGRHTVTATLKCPKCGRNVSQKDKDGYK